MSALIKSRSSCSCGNTHELLSSANGDQNGYDGIFFVYGFPYMGKDDVSVAPVKLERQQQNIENVTTTGLSSNCSQETPVPLPRNQPTAIVEPLSPPPPPPVLPPSPTTTSESDSDEDCCGDPRAALAAELKKFHKSNGLSKLRPASERKLGPKRRPLRRSNTVGPTSGPELQTQVRKLNFRSHTEIKNEKIPDTVSRPQRAGSTVPRSSGSDSEENYDTDHSSLIVDRLKKIIPAVRGPLSSSDEESEGNEW